MRERDFIITCGYYNEQMSHRHINSPYIPPFNERERET